MVLLRKARSLIRRVENYIFNLKCRRQCKTKDFSIISQNCIGGAVYKRLGLPFLSPTINGFFRGEDFCKLCEDPLHYFQIDAALAPQDLFPDLSYPVLQIDDIYFFAMHFKDPDDALSAWNRRRHRMNYSKVIVLANEWDLEGKDEYISRIQNLCCPKMIFVFSERYKTEPNCLFLDKKYTRRGPDLFPVPNIIEYLPNGCVRHFENDFPFYKLLSQRLLKQ